MLSEYQLNLEYSAFQSRMLCICTVEKLVFHEKARFLVLDWYTNFWEKGSILAFIRLMYVFVFETYVVMIHRWDTFIPQTVALQSQKQIVVIGVNVANAMVPHSNP